MITINGIDITSDNPKWFTVIDGYLMSEELLQRYNRIIPMRVLRAIDVLPNYLWDDFSYQFAERLINLDYWSYIWVLCYLQPMNRDVSTRERDILFERLMKQYHKAKNEL